MKNKITGYSVGIKSGAYRMIPPFDDTQEETLGQGLAMTGCFLWMKYGWIIGIIILVSIVIDIIKR